MLAGGLKQASAHPHLFVTNQTTVLFEDGKAVALKMRWSFDAFFTALIREEFDADKNGTLSKAEVDVVAVQAFSNLKEFNYFTQAQLKGKDVTFADVQDFNAVLGKRDVVYTFTLRLPEPVAAEKLTFSVRDPSYYTDVAYDEKEPIRFAGEYQKSCRARLTEDTENPYYFGLVYPIRVDLNCKTS